MDRGGDILVLLGAILIPVRDVLQCYQVVTLQVIFNLVQAIRLIQRMLSHDGIFPNLNILPITWDPCESVREERESLCQNGVNNRAFPHSWGGVQTSQAAS